MPFDQYWERFEKAGLALLEKGRVKAGSYEKTIATTWALSIAEVSRECLAAVVVLQVCSMLATEAIPLAVVSKGGEKMGQAVVAAIKDGSEAVLVPLSKYSIIDWLDGTDVFSVHRMVQYVTRENMSEEEKRKCAEQAVAAVNAAFENIKFEDWTLCERLVPHSYACLKWMNTYAIETVQVARLCKQTDCYLSDRGRYVEAEFFSRHALNIQEKIQEPDHPDVATSLNNLAELLRGQSKLADAEILCRRALEIREKIQVPDHHSVATSLNNLAGLLEGQGNREEAESLYRRALNIRQTVLEPNHPAIANSLNNLAGLLARQGKLDEAEPLYRQSLDILETALNPDYPTVAGSINNLAALLADQGKLDEAEPLLCRALEIREKFLGLYHPSVATSLNNLAELLRVKGKLAEAEPLYHRALEIVEKALGPNHLYVAICLENLALLLLRTNRADEAALLIARAKAIRKAHAQRNNLPYDEDDA